MASPGMMSSTVTTSPSSTGSNSTCPAQRASVPASSVMEERKRKRKESNRLSAQRSRARKQRQLDELTAQVAALRTRNGTMAAAAQVAARQCTAVQAENKLLRARSLELGARLQYLLEIIQYMDAASAVYNPSPFTGAAMHLQSALLDATMYNSYY